MITGNSLKFSENKNFEIVSINLTAPPKKCGATNNRIWLAYKFALFLVQGL